jgi:uncharacterized protein
MLLIVQQLLVLQERDQRIRSLTRDLKEIPSLQKRAELRLEDDTNAVASAQAKVREVELKIKTLELDVNTRKTSILRLKDQQFNTRKNEEFRAMGHEIERYEKEVHDLEDKELDLMGDLEAVKPDLVEAQKKLAATKKSVDEEIVELGERGKALEARLTELKAERSKLVENIDSTPLAHYDRLMKSKGDAAVVLMENGICQGCHVRVVSGTLQALRTQAEITNCEQCGRILYQEG